MKTTKLTLATLVIAAIFSQSCTKEYSRIEGIGSISTQTLSVENFSGIAIFGVDEVFIKHGPVQKVEVTGHPNIISRIRRDVSGGIWHLELENGNYGHYDLTYYITLPSIEHISNTGSANVTITDPMEEHSLEVWLTGSGSLFGFPLQAEDCQVDITGSGDCEITANQHLDVNIDGSGSVFYKGKPSIREDISGSGRVADSN